MSLAGGSAGGVPAQLMTKPESDMKTARIYHQLAGTLFREEAKAL